MGDLSANFNRSEFRDKRTGTYMDPPCHLLTVLEVLRSKINRPIIIVSGYRTPATNRAVGGAKLSRHLVGDAVDIPAGLATVDQAVAAGATGVGSRDGWAVHVDVRPGPVVRWTYD